VNDDDLAVSELPPWRLWPERERVLAALAETRSELAVRLCRWPLSLADLSRRSGVTTFTLCRLRSQAAQDWPVYRRLDDIADAGATIKLARRYARLRADLHVLDERAAAEAQRLRGEGLGWKRVNGALGAPPGADTGWVRVLLARRERSAGRTRAAAGTTDQNPPSNRKGPKP
jgi:lambda repressor-like predicted transcriptional regulator